MGEQILVICAVCSPSTLAVEFLLICLGRGLLLPTLWLLLLKAWSCSYLMQMSQRIMTQDAS